MNVGISTNFGPTITNIISKGERGRAGRVHLVQRIRWLLLSRNYATSLREVLLALPPLDLSRCSSFRHGMKDWQMNHGQYLTDPTIIDNETKALQNFTATSQASDHQDADSDLYDFESSLWREAVGDQAGATMALDQLMPGALVEISSRVSVQDPILAVVIQAASISESYWILTINGRLATTPSNKLHWQLPRYIDAAKLTGVRSYIPPDFADAAGVDIKVHNFGISRDVTGSIISAMNDFRDQVNQVYRTHALRLDSAHEILSDKTELQFGTLTSIAQSLIGQEGQSLDAAALYAVRKALLRNPAGFRSLRRAAARRSQMWQIKPQRLSRQLQLAREWIRTYRQVLISECALTPYQLAQMQASEGYKKVHSFLDHARQLVLKSRRDRPSSRHGISPSLTVGPTKASRREHGTFTSSDIILISVFENWCLRGGFDQDLSMQSLPSFLIKQTGLYDEHEPDPGTGILFLQELGCLTPGTNIQLWSADAMLPGQGLSVRYDKLYLAAQNADPDVSPQADSVRDLRHDWADLPVYCIDDSSAREIDDGISVEPISASDKQYWVRVHVANPTAFVTTNDVSSSIAQQLSQTLYTSDKIIHMLPPYLRDLCSLKPSSPTMTFSFRINLSGQTLEQDVRLGRVHNVLRISYDQVDNILGTVPSTKPNIQILNGQPPYPLRPAAASSYQKLSSQRKLKVQEDLEIISKLAQAMATKRAKAAGLQTSLFNQPLIQVFTQASEPRRIMGMWNIFDRTKSWAFTGDPVISIQTTESKPHLFFPSPQITARSAVAQMMLAANETGAKWAAQRNIPMIFRGQLTRLDQEEIQELQAGIFDQRPQQSYTWRDVLRLVQHRAVYARAFSSTQPVPYYSLGFEAYTKATSPLRRYGDMIAHWQIQAALRYEDESKVKLGSDHAGARLLDHLPFSKTNLDAVMMRLSESERTMRACGSTSDKHWIAQFYQRAFHHGQASLPDRFEVLVLSKLWQNAPAGFEYTNVFDTATGIPMCMLRDHRTLHAEQDSSLRKFDVWECEIDRVCMNQNVIYLRPIRLVDRIDEDVHDKFDRFIAQMANTVPQLPHLAG